MRHRHLIALLAVLAAPAPAAAQGVVLESYPGDRPGDAESLLAPLLAELEGRGYVVGPDDLGQRVDSKLSRSGHKLSSEKLARAKRLVDDGWRHWVNGNFDGAVENMSEAIDLLGTAHATIARDQSLRDPMRRALVGLALAHKRLGNAAEATTAMAEVVRSFPDRAIDKSTFGPEAKAFFTRVEGDMKERGKGSLRVDVDDDNAVVFFNERYVALGSTTLDDLYAGRYRVYLQRGDERGRIHIVDVEPGAEATLSVSYGLDASLRTHGFVGFEFDSADEQEQSQPRYATTVARAVGASGVIVVGIKVIDGRRVMHGANLLLDTAQTLREAYLPIEPVAPNATQVRSLAVFLAGGEATDDLVIVGDKKPEPVDTVDGDRPLRVWKWVALGTGAVAAGVGGYLISIDGDCSTEVPAGGSCAELYETQNTGLLLGGAGAALIVTGVILWIKDDPERPQQPARTAIVAPTGDGLIVGVGGTF